MPSGRQAKAARKLSKELESIDNRILENLNRAGLVTIQKQEIRSFSGPIPSPEILEHYNMVYPGMARDVVDMARDQSAHRINSESKIIEANIEAQRNGQKSAERITYVCLGVTLILALTNHANVAMLVGGGTVTSLAAVFITGKFAQSKERKDKDKARQEAAEPSKA